VHKADNLPPSCGDVKKSGNLNFLEPSGPVTGLLYLFICSYMCMVAYLQTARASPLRPIGYVTEVEAHEAADAEVKELRHCE